jgi:tetratricopeptide (TPR) repeat protein
MVARTGQSESLRDQAPDSRPLVGARLVGASPDEAMARAREILAGNPSPSEESIARQAIGVVLREFGDIDAAIRELRTALRLAQSSGSTDRQADVLATLGVTLTYHGQTGQGLAALDSALTLAAGQAAGYVLARRGIALWRLGRHSAALDDLRRAVRVLRAAGDTIWEARAMSARALVYLACGATGRADRDLRRAETLFATTSQDVEVAYTWHNRGLVAFRSGDVPRALSCLDEADRRYRAFGVSTPDLSIDRCTVLLAGGLAGDALREADRAVRGFPKGGGQATKKAELLLVAARSALAATQPRVAKERAGAARRMFGSQGRSWWQAHAWLLQAQARFAVGPPSARLLQQAEQVASRLDELSSGDSQQARLLAGRIALALGRRADADRHLAAAARVRHRRAAALARSQGWLAEALRAAAAGNRRRLLSACRHGLAVLDEHQLTLGAAELRAQATAQGAELAALAQRAALASGDPRKLLAWSERWRATALAIPASRPVQDADLQAELTALRDVTSRLERARADGDPTVIMQREQLRLEAAVRARVLRSRALRRGESGYHFDVPDFLRELGLAHLVQIVDIDGDLHLVVCGSSRVRHFLVGRMEEATREVDYALFSLRRLAHGRGSGQEGSLTLLEAIGARLETVLLGPASRHLGDGPVIVVPPASLHAVPWALLPPLRDRPVSVAASARSWLQARAVKRPDRTEPVLVRGPGLGAGGGEVQALAREYPDATVLASGAATARKVLDALDGAPLAHIAAHGTFRSDSPLFSSLQMDDGPLTVHDLEGLRCAPYRMILSSCDSGVLAPAGANELLGLASTLAPLGTAGIVASVVPVNDQATIGLMLALHRHLRAGATLGQALCSTRAEAGSDPVQAATAWSLIALGAC